MEPSSFSRSLLRPSESHSSDVLSPGPAFESVESDVTDQDIPGNLS